MHKNIVCRTRHKGCELQKLGLKQTQPSLLFDSTNENVIW